MITGDIKETAQAIAIDIGIIEKSEVAERSFTGMEFFQFSEEKQTTILKKALSGATSGLVFSRTEPKHKRLLV